MIAWLARWRVVLLGAALWLAMLLGLLSAGCAAFGAAPETQLELFVTNGCSSSPDLGPAVVCCDRHDHHYRTGGPLGTWTERQRLASDRYLAACLTQFERLPELAVLAYYEAVRGPGGAKAWAENRERASNP